MNAESTALPPAPASLAAPDGRYAGAVSDLATRAWDGSRGLLSRRRLQRKGWMYFGAFSPEFSIGLAVIDAGIAATAFVYVADRERGTMVEEKLLKPFGFAAAFAPDWRQPWRLAGGGREWNIERGGAGWRIRYAGRRIALEMACGDHGRALTAISSAPGRPFAHTCKLAALDTTVDLELDGRAQRFEAAASMDFTLGYPPRSTIWNWASLDGRTEDGERVAVNLVAHFMNGLENALWLGDELIPLAQALFDYDRAQPMQPWRIRTLDGCVDVVFTPQGQRAENLRAGLMASVFAQPWGRFEGTVLTARGLRRVNGYGVVEEHRALW